MTPRKRICCAVEACYIGKVCTNPLLGTVCSALSPEMNSEYSTQAVAELNSQFRLSESSDSEQHHRSIQGSQEGDTPARETRKTQTPEEVVADTAAYQSHLIPIQIFFLWYEEFVFNSFIFVENPSHCS